MKKKIIWLITVVLLLAAMAAALVLLNKAPAAADESSSSAAETIFVMGSYDSPAPDTVEIQNETGRLSIYNKTLEDGGSEAVLKGFEGFSLDSYGLNNVMSGAKYLTAKRVVEENAGADALTLYGLDKPRATVTAKTGSDIMSLLVGGDAPGGEGTYVKLKDGETVYLVYSTLTDPFLRSELDFINKTITETDPEFSGFDRIVLSGENYPEPIVLERIPEEDKDAAAQMRTHLITSPISAEASQIGLETLSSVYGLLANRVVAVANENEAEILESFGLKEPAASVSLTSNSQALSFTLRVSAPNPDGTVYLIKNGSPVIYELDQSALPWMELTLFDYMSKVAVMPHIDSVSVIRLTIDDAVYEFSLEGEGDELTVSFGGAPLPDAKSEDGSTTAATSNFRKFYQTLLSASYSEETETQPGEDAPLIMSIEYARRDGGASDFVRFYGGAPTRRAYISVNGGTVYLTPSTYIDRVAEDVVKLIDGIPVKVAY